ncbi:MAG: SURF1 family protein [Trueperaceae bacterium]
MTPKWLFGHLLVLAVVVSFTQFGFWQLRRHAERSARNEVTVGRAAAEPVALDEALAAAAAEAADGLDAAQALRDRRVRVAGWFEPEDEVLRRPVSRDGMPGYHVVTPLRLEDDPDGRRLWVERGWVPDAFDAVPVAEAAPPEGRVEVVGWLRATTAPPTGWVAAIAPRDPPSGRLTTVAYLDPERLGDQVGGPLVPAVLWLESDVGSAPAVAAQTLPLPPEPSGVTSGPHLGYAIQWFAFVLVTVVGYAALLRRVTREG